MLSEETVVGAIVAHESDRIRDWRGAGKPYRTGLWTFTRHIKSGCEPDGDSDEVFDVVDQLIRQHGGWEQVVPGMADEEIYLEFVSNWRDIKYGTDETVLDRAYRAAQLEPLSHERYAENQRLDGYAEFISLAGHLQRIVGNSPIMLPEERVGEVLGKDPKTVGRYRQKAEDDGFLILVARHVPRRLATKFRFNIDVFSELMGQPVHACG